MSAKHAATLLTSRRFVPLFGAQMFGAFNDQFLKMAMITLVTWGSLDVFGLKASLLVPLAGALFTAPFFLFSAMAGQVSDKYDKAFVLLRVKQAEIFIMLLAALGLLLNSAPILFTTLVLMGAQSAFFSPTRNAVLPQWLDDKELITGNALMNGFVSVSILVGQALGILLVLSTGGPKLVAGILVVFAVFGWLAIRKAPPAPSQNPDIKIDRWILPEIGKTLVFAAKVPRVFKPMLGTAWYYWLSSGVLILMPAYIREVLYYDQGVLIRIMVLFTIGALMGALTCMIVSKGKEGVGISAVGALGVALCSADLFFLFGDSAKLAYAFYVPANGDNAAVLGTFENFRTMPASMRFMVDLVGAAFFASLFVIPLNAMAQRRADPGHRARLLAAGALLLNASTTLSQLVVAAVGVLSLPMRSPLLLIAVISGLIAIYVFYRAGILKKEAI
ncbi:MAG: MFS transporter [Robiginitomaculum sp.]|nr:MAG: MFS transporter [Robiginitomaculum sp.]